MLIVIGPSQEAFPDSFLTFSPIYLYYLLYPYNPSRSMSLTSRLPSALKEIRLHLCQSSPRSAGAREFLTANYANIKKSNPELPLLIREAQGVRAMAWARFELGKESSVSLDGLSSSEVRSKVQQLLQSGGSA